MKRLTSTPSRKPLRTFTTFVVTILIITFMGQSARGYDDDTHFWLTYYLARRVGFDSNQALQIASADISVDYDKQTWPVLPLSLHMQDQRRMFHAFPSTKKGKTCRDEARKQIGKPKNYNWQGEERKQLEDRVYLCLKPLIDEEQNARWDEAIRIGNPGIFLHFYQDRFAHRGFETRLGHLRAGHIPDFLSSDVPKAYEMVQGTIGKLRDFMAVYFRDKPLPPEPRWEEIKPVVDSFVQANDAKIQLESIYASWDWDSTMVLSRLVYDEESDPQPERRPSDLLRLLSKLNTLPFPNSYKAYQLVDQIYPGEVKKVWMYELKKDGRPAKDAQATPYWYSSKDAKLSAAGPAEPRMFRLVP